MNNYVTSRQWKLGIAMLVVLLSIKTSFYFLTGPTHSPVEKPSPFPIASTIIDPRLRLRDSPRPTHPKGHEISCDGFAPRDILNRFVIDKQGFVTDRQVEDQLAVFSRSDFSGWNQHIGWEVLLSLEREEALEQMGLVESQLKFESAGLGNATKFIEWRISPSYRLRILTVPSQNFTTVSFPTISN